jgi:hypothetical protein
VSDLDPTESFRALNEEMNQIFDEMFDYNAKIFSALRNSIERMEIIRDAYTILSEKADDLITLMVKAGQLTAKQSGDLLMSQFDVSDISFEEEDDDEED